MSPPEAASKIATAPPKSAGEYTAYLDAAWGLLLVAAEVYAALVLLLGYFQTAWPLKRKPLPLPADRSQWPTVDVFIPTYNEPLSVVKPTIYAALALDYPSDKLAIHVRKRPHNRHRLHCAGWFREQCSYRGPRLP